MACLTILQAAQPIFPWPISSECYRRSLAISSTLSVYLCGHLGGVSEIDPLLDGSDLFKAH